MNRNSLQIYNRILRQQHEQTIRETQAMINRQKAFLNSSHNTIAATTNNPIKAAKQAEKERQKEIDNNSKITIAKSKLTYIEDRIKTIKNLLENAENKRDGTIPGGKEYKRYTKEILSYENQLQSLDENWTKAKTVIDKLT